MNTQKKVETPQPSPAVDAIAAIEDLIPEVLGTIDDLADLRDSAGNAPDEQAETLHGLAEDLPGLTSMIESLARNLGASRVGYVDIIAKLQLDAFEIVLSIGVAHSEEDDGNRSSWASAALRKRTVRCKSQVDDEGVSVPQQR